jgi:hypothetical protein
LLTCGRFNGRTIDNSKRETVKYHVSHSRKAFTVETRNLNILEESSEGHGGHIAD